MTPTPDDIRSLIGHMMAESDEQRQCAVDSALDWIQSYDERTGAIVSRAMERAQEYLEYLRSRIQNE